MSTISLCDINGSKVEVESESVENFGYVMSTQLYRDIPNDSNVLSAKNPLEAMSLFAGALYYTEGHANGEVSGWYVYGYPRGLSYGL